MANDTARAGDGAGALNRITAAISATKSRAGRVTYARMRWPSVGHGLRIDPPETVHTTVWRRDRQGVGDAFSPRVETRTQVYAQARTYEAQYSPAVQFSYASSARRGGS